MNVNSSNGMQQQMQMRKMDGSGNGISQGHGAGHSNGMKDIMQQLSSEDKTALQEKMSSMSQADRSAMVEQMKQIDAANMSKDEYAKSIMDVVQQTKTASTTSSPAYNFSTYA